MKKLPVVLALLLFAVVGCESEPTAVSGGTVNSELSDLKAENIRLKNQAAKKDSSINAYAQYINEIRSNLALISDKQSNVFLTGENGEMALASSSDVLSDIESISQLMKRNSELSRKLKGDVSRLKSENAELKLDADEFEKMIIGLTEEVSIKNREIFNLQQQLENSDAAYSELFAAFQETQDLVDIQEEVINTVWFTMGSSKELKNNGVITKEGGLLGIGKTTKLKADFNHDYFTEADRMELKEIPLGAKKVKLLTNHPTSSYELVNGAEKLMIKDIELFWSVSRYLVIELH